MTNSTVTNTSNIHDENSTEDQNYKLDDNLIKALLFKNKPSNTPRLSQDAVSGISKLLHSFIVEARRRALVEVRLSITSNHQKKLLSVTVTTLKNNSQ